jgi:hypothetical protein
MYIWHAYIHTFTWVYIRNPLTTQCMYVCACMTTYVVCIYERTYVCMYLHMCVCVYVYMYAYICVYVSASSGCYVVMPTSDLTPHSPSACVVGMKLLSLAPSLSKHAAVVAVRAQKLLKMPMREPMVLCVSTATPCFLSMRRILTAFAASIPPTERFTDAHVAALHAIVSTAVPRVPRLQHIAAAVHAHATTAMTPIRLPSPSWAIQVSAATDASGEATAPCRGLCPAAGLPFADIPTFGVRTCLFLKSR